MPIPTLLHWKSNTILHPRVNGPCFIFSLDNLYEWIRPRLFFRDINYVVTIYIPIRTPNYLTDFFKFISTFLITIFCLFLGISKVCFWIQYEKVVLHCLLMFLFTFQLSSDIKENSENVRLIASLHFLNKQG
jgi:hypothetical protein